MDVKTILILTALINVLIFIFLYGFIKFSNVKSKVLRIYVLSKFFHVIAWFLLVLRGAIPDFLSIGVANVLIIFAFGSEMLAITSIESEHLKKRIKIFSLLGLVLAIGFLSIIHLDDYIRITYVSTVLFIWHIIAGQQFLIKKNRNRLKIVIGIIYILFSFTSFFRAYYVIFINQNQVLYEANIIQSITFSAIFLSNFIGIVVILLLLKEKDEEIISISEQKFKNFTEFLPQIVFETNTKGNIVYINKKGFELTGYSQKDLKKGINLRDVFVKEDLERLLNKFSLLMSGTGDTGEEYLIQKQNGDKLPVLIYSSPIIEEERAVGMRGIIVDISTRIKDEEEILRLSTAVSQSSNTIVITDIDGFIEYVNPKFEEVTGYTREEAMGLNPRILNAQTQPKEYYANVWKTISSGNTWKGEFNNKKKNGDYFWENVTISPLKDDTGKIINYLAIKEDITARKETELEIRKLTLAVEQSSNTIVITDIDGSIEYVNPKFEELTGYTSEEAIGINPRVLNAQTQPKEHYINLWETLLAGKTWKGEFHNIKKNGEYFWENVTITPIKNDEGIIVNFLAIKEDITARKITEDNIKENQFLLKEAQRIAHLGHWKLDLIENNLTWSDEIYRIFDVNPQEFKPSYELFLDKIHPEDREMVNGAYQNSLKNKIPYEIEHRLLLKDGEIKYVIEKCNTEYDKSGKPVQSIGTVLDITSRKKTEYRLKESEEKFRGIVETASDWIWEVDNNGKFTYSSPKIFQMLGYTAEEIIGKTPFDLMSKREGERVSKIFTGIIEQHKVINEVENTNIHKNGNLVVLETSGMPFFDSNNNFLGYRGVDRDITARKESEKEIAKQTKQLKDLVATKDKFFSIIAHDLRSPIGAMVGFSKLLVDGFDSFDIERQKEYVSILHDGVDKAFKLLENLLLWSRAQQGTMRFQPENENLFLLFNETIDVLRQPAEGKSIILDNKIPRNLSVYVDKDMLLTVFRNLISNAIKFTPKEGQVTIKAQKAINYENCRCVEISIQDNGVGISKEKQLKLFDITKSVTSRGTENEIGTGLGLILCEEFIEKHGGKIWVESEIGKGSTFIITIPMA